MTRSVNKMRGYRLARRMKQSELARRVGSTQSDISAYELGVVVPTLGKALDIANALGARVEQVFFELFEQSCTRVGERS